MEPHLDEGWNPAGHAAAGVVHHELAIAPADVVDALQIRLHPLAKHVHAHHRSGLEPVVVAGEADIDVTPGFFEHDLGSALHEGHRAFQDGTGHFRLVVD